MGKSAAGGPDTIAAPAWFPSDVGAVDSVDAVEAEPVSSRLAPVPINAPPLLEVRGLSRYYGTRDLLARLLQPITGSKRRVRAVEDVSFTLQPGETLALVGESGCGKTTLARTLAGLDTPTSGSITFLGRDVTGTADGRPAAVRRQLQMIFQNPDASLNPRHTVGQVVTRPVNLFLGLRGEAARRRVMELLLSVGLDPSYYYRFPRQLSGGEKQRVSIARAFAGDPQLVICDEAVSALDVSVQATVLNLLVRLQRERGTAYLFISHDLSVVQYLADRIGVMYLGRLVEIGRTEDVIRAPQHPYTEALLTAAPVPDPDAPPRRVRLHGPVPSPTARPAGCPFAGRCPRYLGAVCDDVPPPVQDAGNGHRIACHIPLADLARAERLDGLAGLDGPNPLDAGRRPAQPAAS
jgi:peptide/nickel transport system ATP-binding protein